MTLLVISASLLGTGCQPALKTEKSFYPTNEYPQNSVPPEAKTPETKIPEVNSEPLPHDLPNPRANGFRNTHYYLVEEADYSKTAPKDQEVLDEYGNIIVLVSTKFKKDLLMEGSGRLLDGRVLNYHGKVDGTFRFHVTSHLMGRGAGNCALVPFRSIAVDPAQIAVGSQVFIDETVGMLLPDGSIHDGFWNADDTGSAILHDRVDIFIGVKRNAKTLSLHGISHMKPLTIRVLKEPDLFSCVFESPQ